MPIRVISLDFDGCIFNPNYVDTPGGAHMKFPNTFVLTKNKAFLDKLIQENAAFDRVYTYVGSNRQDYATDLRSSSLEKPSCFPAMTQITEHLQAKFNSLLLADIYADLPEGESYRRIDEQYPAATHANWMVTPQVRHPERVFLREGSPGSGTVSNISIGINLSIQD